MVKEVRVRRIEWARLGLPFDRHCALPVIRPPQLGTEGTGSELL